MPPRSLLGLFLLSLCSCGNGASPAAVDDAGQPELPGDDAGAEGEPSPTDDAGQADGEPDEVVQPREPEPPVVTPPFPDQGLGPIEVVLAAQDGGDLPLRVVDSAAFFHDYGDPDSDYVTYDAFVRLENTGDTALRLSLADAQASDASGQMAGAYRHHSASFHSSLCSWDARLEPCVMPGEVFVMASDILVSDLAAAQQVAKLTVTIPREVLPELPEVVSLGAALTETPDLFSLHWYDLAGTFTNQSDHALFFAALHVFPVDRAGRIVGHYPVVEAWFESGSLDAPLEGWTHRKGAEADAFLWFVDRAHEQPEAPARSP